MAKAGHRPSATSHSSTCSASYLGTRADSDTRRGLHQGGRGRDRAITRHRIRGLVNVDRLVWTRGGPDAGAAGHLQDDAGAAIPPAAGPADAGDGLSGLDAPA